MEAEVNTGQSAAVAQLREAPQQAPVAGRRGISRVSERRPGTRARRACLLLLSPRSVVAPVAPHDVQRVRSASPTMDPHPGAAPSAPSSDTSATAAAPPESYTILRVKRKRNEEPLDALGSPPCGPSARLIRRP